LVLQRVRLMKLFAFWGTALAHAPEAMYGISTHNSGQKWYKLRFDVACPFFLRGEKNTSLHPRPEALIRAQSMSMRGLVPVRALAGLPQNHGWGSGGLAGSWLCVNVAHQPKKRPHHFATY
jgi:hypothetical protein